jgi:lipopolysaccharide export system permease protein
MSDAKLALSDVLLIERRPPQTPSQKGATSVILQAATGEYDRGVWTFQQPYVRVLAGEDLISARPGKDVVVRDPINIQDFLGQPFKEAKTISDLHLAIDQARKLKGDTKALEIELCERYSIPFSCFVFSVLGPVLAIMLSRSGAFVGVFMSLIMVMVYYNAYVIFGQIVGKNGWVPPIVAAWTPNVIFLLIGIWMLRRVE